MSTEIEIKFVVKPEAKEKLALLLQGYTIVSQSVKPLSNTYFDTTTYQFRQLDFGLRTRKSIDFAEQTIKTAGTVIGGLHQRPEYNVPLCGETPSLADFPAEIWPQGTDVAQLQRDLMVLFTTDFERYAWHIRMPDGAEIEVVFDQGRVTGGEQDYPICEIELELLSGSVASLFVLARQITQFDNVRLGNVSKAQRGYQVTGLYTPQVKPLNLQPLPDDKPDLAEIFLSTLQQAYSHWQYHEQLYHETQNIEALAELKAGVELIHQTVLTFSGALAESYPWMMDLIWLEQKLVGIEGAVQLQQILTNNGHYIRNFPEHARLLKELKQQQVALVEPTQIEQLITSKRYALLTLAITELLVTANVALSLPEDQSALAFAASHLEQSWQSVLNSPLSSEQLDTDVYLTMGGYLHRNLLVGTCFSQYYQSLQRDQFRLPWQDIIQGIEDLKLIQLLEEWALQQPDETCAQVQKKLSRKRSSLIDALEQTRRQALTMEPYWR